MDDAAVGVGDPDRASSLYQSTESSRDEDADERDQVRVQEATTNRQQLRRLGRARGVRRAQHGLGPAGCPGQSGHVAPGGDEAEQRERRQEQRDGEEPGCRARVPWPEAKPVMHADRGVEPREDERERLTGAELGREHPEREHDPVIRIVGAEPPPGDPRAHDVDDQERRQGQPDRVLNRLPPRHAQASPVVQEPERQHAVHRDRAVERQSAESVSPERQEPPAPGRHRVERDEPERVVREVEGQVQE